MIVQNRLHPQVVGVNATVQTTGSMIGGFATVTSGNLTITNSFGVVILNAFPVTAGLWHNLPFFVGLNGATVVAAGGASGTLGVA